MITCNHLLLGGGKINKIKKVGKNFLSQLLCISTIFGTASCNDDQVFNQADTAPLQVSVNAQGTQSSRAIIHGEYLPDGSSIGISLFTPDGADYDNQGYFNVKYTASGEGESQSWAAQGTTPSISANEAFLLAYYPYNQDVETIDDLFALPVENQTQTDYMYAHPVTGVTNANPKVNIIMQHALTAIRVNLVLGNYTGDAAVSGIAVKSPALGSAATMDITNNGALNGISGQGDEFALTTEFDLIPVGTATDVLFVPDASVTEGSTTVSATIGGKKYTAAISFDEAYLQGYIYTYTLTLNNSGFQLAKVNVIPWKPGNDDSATLEPDNSYAEDEYVIKVLMDEDYIYKHNIIGFIGTIDWGDGTTDTYTEATDWPEHIYYDAAVGSNCLFTVKAKGSMMAIRAVISYYGNRCETPYIKEIVHIGSKLDYKRFDYAFAYQSKLDNIYPNAIKGCNATDFYKTFFGCTSLTTIPSGLFDNCTEVTSFQETFDECTNLQSIPSGLFDAYTKETSFQSTFRGCSNLTSIPEGLFDNCTEVTIFERTFEGCTSLQAIPEGLFDNCTEVTNFAGTFAGCSALTSIPEGLFDNCTEVESFCGTFQKCTSLTSVPDGLFDKCTEVTSFGSTFEGCNALTTIPEGLFDACTEVTDFGYAFNGCTALTGESPYTIINIDGVDTKVHLYERSNYPDIFSSNNSFNIYCFKDCTGLTDYENIPSGWK